MKTYQSRTTASRASVAGISLVELMIALTLGLLIASGMLTLIAQNSDTRGEIEKAGRQIENGRYAIQRLTEDIHHAGFYGEFFDLPVGTVTPTDACSTDLTVLKASMSFPVQAFTDAATPPSCIDTADFVAGTTVLVLRFVSPTAALAEGWASADIASTLAPGVVYAQPYVEGVNFATRTSSPTAATLFAGSTVSGPLGALVTAPIYRYITRLYFLSPCSRPATGQAHCTGTADDGFPVPTLKMVELGSNGTSGTAPTWTNGTAPAFSSKPVAVAEGVEQLQFDFGIDSLPAVRDGAPDAYNRCTSCTAAQWQDVVAVRISALVRNTDRTNGYSDAKSYAMGLVGNVSAPSGSLNFKRHLFQSMARLNNASMRREQ